MYLDKSDTILKFYLYAVLVFWPGVIVFDWTHYIELTRFLSLSALFREFGGARCVHNIVKYRQCREHALSIIQQLVLSPSGDDDMGTLLGLMHSAPSSELQLKTDILRVTAHA